MKIRFSAEQPMFELIILVKWVKLIELVIGGLEWVWLWRFLAPFKRRFFLIMEVLWGLSWRWRWLSLFSPESRPFGRLLLVVWAEEKLKATIVLWVSAVRLVSEQFFTGLQQIYLWVKCLPVWEERYFDFRSPNFCQNESLLSQYWYILFEQVFRPKWC